MPCYLVDHIFYMHESREIIFVPAWVIKKQLNSSLNNVPSDPEGLKISFNARIFQLQGSQFLQLNSIKLISRRRFRSFRIITIYSPILHHLLINIVCKSMFWYLYFLEQWIIVPFKINSSPVLTITQRVTIQTHFGSHHAYAQQSSQFHRIQSTTNGPFCEKIYVAVSIHTKQLLPLAINNIDKNNNNHNNRCDWPWAKQLVIIFLLLSFTRINLSAVFTENPIPSQKKSLQQSILRSHAPTTSSSEYRQVSWRPKIQTYACMHAHMQLVMYATHEYI